MQEEDFWAEIDEPTPEVPEPDEEELEQEQEEDIFEVPENKKRAVFSIKHFSATTIVRGADLAIANLSARVIAKQPDKVAEYRADEQALNELEKAVEQALPDTIQWLERQPSFIQILILLLITYLPIIIKAFVDRFSQTTEKPQSEPNFKVIQNNQKE